MHATKFARCFMDQEPNLCLKEGHRKLNCTPSFATNWHSISINAFPPSLLKLLFVGPGALASLAMIIYARPQGCLVIPNGEHGFRRSNYMGTGSCHNRSVRFNHIHIFVFMRSLDMLP